ncbi:GNAT family N-acetyltransferase [Brevibacillus laterosporus]|uniref:N-acetyltransferase n=1 Tax=Brevibacillus laterosporus TaxID=1465 RepID=A0AAP8QAJ2_BRELA|nr:GNAT family N-acetyltransferase [Brevibacillus laterosporus]MED1665554.1 N-acetyltransferase [Brevibacillus laterosporus]MED1668488.1 N-acetyltransferase [Brevibacillus laterosporus]MED1716597.1 N-acetyltransferase [Brevibacillus laterosporus]PPA84913.1 N-acetyltransferase [Brevibacillus laterosporus]PPA92931.1 N-acetyltransferase [Brevibacillus laterosporus]
MEIIWHDIKDIESPLIPHALDLYEQMFTEDLREPNDILLKGLTNKGPTAPDTFHLLVGTNENQQVVAVSTFHYLATWNLGFIVYMMVNPAIQSGGVGSKMMSKIEKILQEDAQKHDAKLTGFVLETEREEDAHDEEEQILTQRRLRFFNRNGLVPVKGIPYKQPPLWENTKEVPLHLLVKWTKDTDGFLQEEWYRFVQDVYKEKYGKINNVKPEILHEMEAELLANLQV